MELANIIVPSKTVDMEYPGFDDLYFSIAYLTRDELMKIRKKATTQKFNKRSRQPEEEVDNDLFQDLYMDAVIKGWHGFKYSYLEKMIPVDTSKVPEEEYCGVDEEGNLGEPGSGEFEYSRGNARVFMKNCSDFDTWITSQMDDVENFTKNS